MKLIGMNFIVWNSLHGSCLSSMNKKSVQYEPKQTDWRRIDLPSSRLEFLTSSPERPRAPEETPSSQTNVFTSICISLFLFQMNFKIFHSDQEAFLFAFKFERKTLDSEECLPSRKSRRFDCKFESGVFANCFTLQAANTQLHLVNAKWLRVNN